MLRILKETPVPVVPLSLSGLWDSMSAQVSAGVAALAATFLAEDRFDRRHARVAPEQAEVVALRERVVELRGATR